MPSELLLRRAHRSVVQALAEELVLAGKIQGADLTAPEYSCFDSCRSYCGLSLSSSVSLPFTSAPVSTIRSTEALCDDDFNHSASEDVSVLPVVVPFVPFVPFTGGSSCAAST